MELLRCSALAVLLISSAAMDVTVTSTLTFDTKGTKNRPVTKVINLLKDMLKQLQKEAEDDEEIYDKIACWCETNDKEKTKAIAEAEAKIDALTTEIEELTAQSARLTTEIKNLEAEVAKLQDSLDKATAIRQKELAEFNAEEKDLLESITALKSAIVVLSKHHASLLQVPTTHILSVAATLQHEMSKHGDLLEGVLTPKQRRMVTAFVQAPDALVQGEDYFDAEPTFKQSYAPESGQIFGILTQMKETFDNNLSAAQKDEMAAQKAYEELKAAKEAEIAAAQDSIEKKTQQLADTDEKNAAAKEDLQNTKESLAADEQFLMMLKEKCQMTDQEWEERQKTRQLEMEAVSKALAVLSSDDAHDLFTKTFNPALLQKESASNSARQAQASKLLNTVAHKLNSPRLATLSLKVRLDAFTRVKKAIDDMIANLLQEKQDEIKHRDFCIEEFNTNQLETDRKNREKSDLIAKIEDLEHTIDTLTSEIETLKSEIVEMQSQLKRAGENRDQENKEFQQTVADQRATAKLLKQALTFLEGFYGKSALMQEPAGPPPPPGFKAYSNNKASGGVMGMIKQIIADTKAMEAETIRAEEEGQKAYEDFVKDTNASIEAKSTEIVDKSELKAKAETDKAEAESALEEVGFELDHLADAKLELHQSCDFVLKNFEIRQTGRDEEIEALKQAKAILSGAKFEAFLQNKA